MKFLKAILHFLTSAPKRCKCLPPLDDWVDGHPNAWDYDAVLRANKVIVEWCDTLVDGNGSEHRAVGFAGCGLSSNHGPSTLAARPRSSPVRPSLLSPWLRSVSAGIWVIIASGDVRRVGGR